MSKPDLVAIVDDDESVRESLPDLLKFHGYQTIAFAGAEAFLAWPDLQQTRCLILDIAMPGMTGPELQQALLERRLSIPIVFITATTSEADRARVLQRGAVACLIKPFDEEALIGAVQAAFARG